MTRLTTHLTLTPDAPMDLHMHTTYSDGRWPAQQLIDYLVNEGFDLVAVTDHDRVDMVANTQALAAAKNLPVLAGVEMSTQWNGQMGHMLCYGFDPENNYLSAVTQNVVRSQLENTHAVHDELVRRGHTFPREAEVLAENDGKLRRPADNGRLLREHGYAADWQTALRMIREAGFHSIMANMAETVEAAHRSGAFASLPILVAASTILPSMTRLCSMRYVPRYLSTASRSTILTIHLRSSKPIWLM